MFASRRVFSALAAPASRRLLASAPVRFSSTSVWNKVEKGPEDPILGVSVAFNKDTNTSKMNLGVGAYRGDDGKPYVLDSVRTAEKRILDQKLDHEYLPIAGLASFTKAAAQLALGADSAHIKEKRIATVQTISGTGALRVAAEFINRFLPGKEVYFPDPTWGNHQVIFKDAGVKNVKAYKYYDPKTVGLDLNGLLQDLKNATPESVIVLHACAHNPTGVDPTIDQWKQISQVCKEKKHFVLFDCAYQGFASGDPEKDVAAVRLFINDGHNIGLCQSFAKNFGLYGQRAGALSFLTATSAEAEAVESQLKILIRPMYSNPPLQGARIVETVLTDPELKKQWHVELQAMADRMNNVRVTLVKELKAAGSTRNWDHITKQIGMMAFTGLNKDQVARLKSEFHIYMTDDGRAAITGLNSRNVQYVAKAFHEVTK